MDRLTKIILLVAFAWPLTTRAETPVAMTWELQTGLHRAGDVVPVRVKLDSRGQLVNALDVPIVFSTVGLEIVSVEQHFTNFPLWPEEPRWDNTKGQLHLTAGRPNGLIAAGATVATVNVRLRAGGLWSLTVADGARAYLNDGGPTAVTIESAPLEVMVADSLVSRQAISSPSHPHEDQWSTDNQVVISWLADPARQYSFSWSQDPAQEPDDIPDAGTGRETYTVAVDGIWWFALQSRGSDGLWGPISRRVVRIDRQAPAAFTLTQLPPATVGGATVIAWNATDATSGIAASSLRVNGRIIGQVVSPLTLKAEWRGASIAVVATDRAGNQTTASWQSSGRTWWPLLAPSWAWVSLAAAAGLAIVLMIIKRQWRT